MSKALEDEALEFVSRRTHKEKTPQPSEDKLIVAVLLAGFLARGSSKRAEELLEEARNISRLL